MKWRIHIRDYPLGVRLYCVPGCSCLGCIEVTVHVLERGERFPIGDRSVFFSDQLTIPWKRYEA